MPTEKEMIRAVHDYVAAFEKNDSELAVALFAENATVEDPVGSPILKGTCRDPGFLRPSYGAGAQAATRRGGPRGRQLCCVRVFGSDGPQR